VQFIQAVLETHEPQAHRAVTQVGVAGFLDGVVVDVDHVVQHSHGRGDRLLQFGMVNLAILDVLQQVDGAQVAHGGLCVAGIERDFGAQVGRVHHARMLLR